MERRSLLAGALAFGIAGLAPTAAARDRPRRIGILSPTPASVIVSEHVPRLYAALKPLGLVQDRDVVIVWRSGELDDRRLPALARELVAEGVDLLSVDGSPATHAARAATTTIPIVTGLGDPQRSGFAKTLARPGGNVTGLSTGFYDVTRRQVDLLRAMYPRLAEIVYFHRPTASPETVEIVVAGVRDAGAMLAKVAVRALGDVTAAFEAMHRRGGCAVITPNYLAPVDPQVIVDMGIAQRIPVATNDSELAASGALVSFELLHRDELARRAGLIAEIFRGGNPAEIPFQLPDSYDLTINRGTARKLGLEIPPDVLLRATRMVD